jgi:hypothetical protein
MNGMEIPIIFRYICFNKLKPNVKKGQNDTDSSYAEWHRFQCYGR